MYVSTAVPAYYDIRWFYSRYAIFSNNFFTSFNLYKLSPFDFIYLNDNQLTEITQFSSHPYLKYIDLSSNKFVNSKYYDCVNIEGYGNDYRVQSAIGLHGKNVDWYKSTLIPVINNKLLEDCKIYHMPNNYVYNNYTLFATIKFDDCIKKDLKNLYIPN
jgi:hypothetical protein